MNTEHSCSVKCETVLDYTSDPQLFRKDCAPCNDNNVIVHVCREEGSNCVRLLLPAFRGSSVHRVTHPLVHSVYLHVYHSHVRFQLLFLNLVFVISNFCR
jgi:hypothetical protein